MGMIQRGMAEAGGALEVAGLTALKSELDEKRQVRLQELATQSAKELQQSGFQHAEKMQGSQQTFQTGERQAGQTFTAGESEKTRAQQTILQATALEHAARENAANRQVQREGQGIQARQVSVLEQGAELDRQVKQMQIKNSQQVEQLRGQYQTETDPEKRSKISENISILTGKDTDKFLPVPLKDDMGNITGYEIFDTKNGRFVDNARPGAGGGAKWDSGSGKVMLDGKEIGKASSEADARALIAKARGGKTPGSAPAPAAAPGGAPAAPSSALVQEPPGTPPAPASDEEIAAAESAGPAGYRGRRPGIIERELNNRNTVY